MFNWIISKLNLRIDIIERADIAVREAQQIMRAQQVTIEEQQAYIKMLLNNKEEKDV